MEKIFLSGGTGMLGNSIIKIFPKKKYKLFFPERGKLDLTDPIKVFNNAASIKTLGKPSCNELNTKISEFFISG